MKHVNSFDDFLKDVVNINSTRLQNLDDSFEAIKKFIRNSTYTPKVSSYFRHGSWAHQTIIRPVEGNPFDADIIVFVQPVEGWEACDYVDELMKVFEGSGTYKDKVRRFSHCATIEYVNDRKMDIAPCVLGRTYEGSVEVCNRVTNSFEASAPEDYTKWIKDRNSDGGNNYLRKVTRLLKYLRDIKTTFTCPSFLLTTLLGLQIYPGDKDNDGFKDLPSALKTVLGRLDTWLQTKPFRPSVFNPVLASEDQASGWTDVQYQNFRTQIHRYRGWVDEAYEEADQAKSLEKWRKVFGDDFGKAKLTKVEANANSERGILATTDDVDVIREHGLAALSPEVAAPCWRKTPAWDATNLQMNIGVQAWIAPFKDGRLMKRIANGEALESDQYIRFTAHLLGSASADAYRTEWRVTNTGPVAARRNSLRGGFELSKPDHTRWEQLSYRGVHMVEAFLIRKVDQVQVGMSNPFYVVIE
ncbi:nucleotidyltransferase [Rhodanobacter sp. OK091]|uniref:SMODS domain-containing nucleotidyltransferase n=1 Tax=Rhodanobacter sp. OK091 TaxID=1881037 RepID=UPI0009171179|nr:nucleotidyltransferase [Rhodanobacter sp. OK091]SHM51842.1 hypothetical protein SAMN05428972_3885 [Rhodanobacter sp. OK091]